MHFERPQANVIRNQLVMVWLVSFLLFGFGPAIVYAVATWLLDEYQWAVAKKLFSTFILSGGAVFAILLPLYWYRPVHRFLAMNISEEPLSYKHILGLLKGVNRLPSWSTLSLCFGFLVGAMVSCFFVYQVAGMPAVELAKVLPAFPLFACLAGAHCFFGTEHVLRPVVIWCHQNLKRRPNLFQISLATKFLLLVYALVVATLCLMHPSAYTMGQTVLESQLRDRALSRLADARNLYKIATPKKALERILRQAAVGGTGYVFAADAQGNILTTHPEGYRHVSQEKLRHLDRSLRFSQSTWIERFGQHRILAFQEWERGNLQVFSVVYPDEFSAPLQNFVKFSMIPVALMLGLVIIFANYYSRAVTNALKLLTESSKEINMSGDFAVRVPVATNDELGDLGYAFNRMVKRLHSSKNALQSYTHRLENTSKALTEVNQEMEEILRAVSHDLRSPLINVQGFASRLEKSVRVLLAEMEALEKNNDLSEVRKRIASLRTELEPRVEQSLKFIESGVGRMDLLIADLLAIARIGRKADTRSVQDLNLILDEALQVFDHQIQQHRITLIRHTLPNAVFVRKNEINQVFANLISNSIKYMGDSKESRIEIGGEEKDGKAICYVEDTGIGIDAADKEKVFTIFTRLKQLDTPGEGFGLAYVHKVVRSHGGEVWVESQLGKGSKFIFTLPIKAIEEPSA